MSLSAGSPGRFALIKLLALAAFVATLCSCSYVGTLVSQLDKSLQQVALPQQRGYKHMLDRETVFVFGKLEQVRQTNTQAVAVLALSDKFRNAEVVDINHAARPDSYYGLNLPFGDYRLLAVSDLDGNGYYDQTDVIGGRDLSLRPETAPDGILSGYHIDLGTPATPARGSFRIPVVKSSGSADSLFYPKGTIRSLDDPLFAPPMATLGMYEPAAFLEAAPMMFYALEEDVGYKIPIVFVHGIGGSVRDFSDILANLDRRRFRPWFFYYPSGADLNQLSAMFYKLFISGKVIPLGDMPMVIIAHSMGGLVVREALNLRDGGTSENHVQVLISIASPLGGHPAAHSAAHAPVRLPAWRDLDPDSTFIAALHRRPLPEGTKYHLMFAYGNDRAVKLGENSDGTVPLASQLSPAAQQEAVAQHGYNATHTGILKSPEAIREILRIAADVRTPFPEPFMRALMEGGYRVALGSHYTPLEAFYIHNLGFFMDAIASGALTPLDPSQQHFVRAVNGDLEPNSAIETAWIKFIREYPDRRRFRTSVAGENGATH